MFEEAAMNGAMGGLPPLESGLLPGGKSSLLIYKVIKNNQNMPIYTYF